MKIWTHEKVREIAKKCKHRSELQEKWSGAFKYVKRNGLMDELFPELFPNHKEPDFWNYDECKKVSKQYKTLTELKSKYLGAYKAMLRYGWLDDFYPNRLKHKPNFDYSTLTYNKCKKIASKYESPSKLMEGDRPIYKFSSENDWLSDFYPNYKKPHTKWTYEECDELLSKYEYLNDFAKEQSGAYTRIIVNKWNGLLDKLNRKQKISGYWTYERCKEHALSCTRRQDMDNTPRHYIYKNGWYELLGHMVKLPTLGTRYIYVFEFDNNCVYIGLSYNPDKRKCDHLCDNSNSTVKKYIDETNCKYEFKILTEALSMKDSSLQERYYIQEYKNKGWVVLNKNKGGSLGGGKKKYTYEECKNKVSEYKTLKEFAEQSSGYYSRIKLEKWLELLEPLEKYKDYIGSFQYYMDKYPEVVKLLKKGTPNIKITEFTGYSHNIVCKAKKRMKEHNKIL
jgi:predicted GIY-YIG superfamily endonuclease